MTNHVLRTTAIALLIAVAAACGAESSAEPSSSPPETRPDEAADVIEATTRDFTFELDTDGPVSAGFVPVRVRNEGDEPHQLVVARLHDGVTLDEFAAAAAGEGEAAAGALVTYAGGVNVVEPGATGEGFADLEPGRYALLCFVPSADGVGHLHKGMAATIEVVDDGSPVAAPSDVVETVTLRDYAVELPADGVGEPGVYAFANEGTEPHEAILLRMKEGKTLADAAAYTAGGSVGEPPFTFAGGAGGIAPGETGYTRLALDPGDYLAVCVITSATHHKAHVDLGMVTPFTVS